MARERVIGLASTSHRRMKALEQIPDLEIIKVGGGEEKQDDPLLQITLSKISFAYPTIIELCQQYDRQLSGVVAADTNTLISILKHGKNKLVRKGKPHDEAITQKYFRQMYKRAQQDGKGYYEVASSSAFQFHDPELNGDGRAGASSGTEVSRITLDPERLRYLQTDEGYAEYVEKFTAFYGSPTYKNQGFSQVHLTDLSGGISLPVLMKMGAVDKINGAQLATEAINKVEWITKLALFNVAVGFSPAIIREIDPDGMNYMMQWEWLQGATDEALAGARKNNVSPR